MNALILDLNDKRWLDFVTSFAETTVFHHPVWSGLLSDCYGYRSFVVAWIDQNGKIVAGLPMMELENLLQPKRWVSLPFSDYCFPLFYNDFSVSLLTETLSALRRVHNVSNIEVRHTLPTVHDVHLSASYVFHSLELCPDPDVVFNNFERKFRQYPRKAEREGLTVHIGNNWEDVNTFYGIHLKTRVKLGVPIQPRRFFNLLWQRMIVNGLGTVVIVKEKTGTPISGAIILYYGRNAMIKFSGSDPTYLHTRCHYLTFWKCIEWACVSGMSLIDFGRTDVEESGLRKFKDGWGAKEEFLTYSTIVQKPSRRSSDRYAKFLNVLIRNSPPVVCKIAGELLYKYAA